VQFDTAYRILFQSQIYNQLGVLSQHTINNEQNVQAMTAQAHSANDQMDRGDARASWLTDNNPSPAQATR